MSQWQKIYSDQLQHRAEIVRSVLFEKGINSVIVNNKNSAFNNFGSFEIKVERHNILKAIKIIDDDIRFE
ncbi:MAG: hypothetical protein OEX22_05895 [Cyclobacteriaceae bacterium]|nr:hypothetical protein [Cyclobacteriaceae bacterium]